MKKSPPHKCINTLGATLLSSILSIQNAYGFINPAISVSPHAKPPRPPAEQPSTATAATPTTNQPNWTTPFRVTMCSKETTIHPDPQQQKVTSHICLTAPSTAEFRKHLPSIVQFYASALYNAETIPETSYNTIHTVPQTIWPAVGCARLKITAPQDRPTADITGSAEAFVCIRPKSSFAPPSTPRHQSPTIPSSWGDKRIETVGQTPTPAPRPPRFCPA